MGNRMHEALMALALSGADDLEPYFPRVRDREDVAVLRCRRSGALLLSRQDHQQASYHEEKEKVLLGAPGEREHYHENLFRQSIVDDQRRARRHESLILNRRWLDVGTGGGGILHLLGRHARCAHGVEPNRYDREHLIGQGITCFEAIGGVPTDPGYEVVTLFHVLEHVPDPLGFLRAIRERMAPGATLLVEVPHARDLLLSWFQCEPFKRFTFWSEHLILHTRETLNGFLRAAGFTNILIEGVQRYPLANHLRWLVEGLPDGHRAWSQLRADDLDAAYANLLARLDATDTLTAYAS
ncbi:MAG: class I SAM-dependent methyltransferase [Magnetococcales bacterium]|nr:class I SAM-dependent methyltransferase [Magnetococcales bacterium]